MRKFYSLAFFIFFFSQVNSQVNYTFSAATGTYTSIVGTSPTLQRGFPDNTVPLTDEGYANGIPIGFTFNYNGTNRTTLSVNTDGFISFVDMQPVTDISTEGYFVDDLEDGPYHTTNLRPVIAPFWDDLDVGSPTNLRYATSGVAPNRVFTMEWANVYADWAASTPTLSFQLKLYETTGVIEFVYRSESGAYTFAGGTSNGASIGLSALARGTGQYLNLNNASASPTASSTVLTDNITTKPATGQIYRFTPSGSLPISLLSFKGERINNLTRLTWTTANEQNNKGFQIQRSADGSNFSNMEFVNSRAVNGNSSSNLQYSFDDVRAFKGSVFYRLIQVDKDNKETVSPIVAIRGLSVTKLSIRNIYPNPTTSLLNMVLASPDNDKINLVVTDLSGKIVLQKGIDVVSGDNNITLNVAKLAIGNYMVKATCTSGCESISTRFVKQ